jgi:predicted phosphohydrolase
MRIVWLSDLHLPFIGVDGYTKTVDYEDNQEQIKQFLQQVESLYTPDALMIGGDIADSIHLPEYLDLLSTNFNGKIYFVTGNHDYYYDSIKCVDKFIKEFCKDYNNLIYLEHSEPIELTKYCALIGSSLWSDTRAGDWDKSNVWISDYDVIRDFDFKKTGWLTGPDYDKIAKKLKYIAGKRTTNLIDKLNTALKKYNNIIMLTHVPVFWMASYYDGKVQDQNWAPHFVCKIAGDRILKVMSKPENENKTLKIYTGHTHGGSNTIRFRENIYIENAEAKYGVLKIQQVIEL